MLATKHVIGLQPIASILKFCLAPWCDQKCLFLRNKYYNILNLVSLLNGQVVLYCLAKLTITDHLQPRLICLTSDTKVRRMHEKFQARMHQKHS